MAMECAAFGFAANLMQLTGTNPVQLIRLIWDSAQYANVHKRNCRQFADNLQRMGTDQSTHKRAESTDLSQVVCPANVVLNSKSPPSFREPGVR